MNRLAPDRFLPYALGKWLQKSHNIKMWSYEKRNKKIITKIEKICKIFEKINNILKRTKDNSFIYK